VSAGDHAAAAAAVGHGEFDGINALFLVHRDSFPRLPCLINYVSCFRASLFALPTSHTSIHDHQSQHHFWKLNRLTLVIVRPARRRDPPPTNFKTHNFAPELAPSKPELKSRIQKRSAQSQCPRLRKAPFQRRVVSRSRNGRVAKFEVTPTSLYLAGSPALANTAPGELVGVIADTRHKLTSRLRTSTAAQASEGGMNAPPAASADAPTVASGASHIATSNGRAREETSKALHVDPQTSSDEDEGPVAPGKARKQAVSAAAAAITEDRATSASRDTSREGSYAEHANGNASSSRNELKKSASRSKLLKEEFTAAEAHPDLYGLRRSVSVACLRSGAGRVVSIRSYYTSNRFD
jgi:hypothetical protein